MSPPLIDPLARFSFVFAADAAAKATIILVLAWAIAALWPRSSAAVRHRLWSLALCGIVISPVVSWSLPAWRFAILPATDEHAGGSMSGDGGTRISEEGPSLDT